MEKCKQCKTEETHEDFGFDFCSRSCQEAFETDAIAVHSAKKVKPLGLYLITWGDGGDYDEFSAFLIAAKSKKEAVDYHPYGYKGPKEDWNSGGSWIKWDLRHELIVKKVGLAAKGVKRGEILITDFNEG